MASVIEQAAALDPALLTALAAKLGPGALLAQPLPAVLQLLCAPQPQSDRGSPAVSQASCIPLKQAHHTAQQPHRMAPSCTAAVCRHRSSALVQMHRCRPARLVPGLHREQTAEMVVLGSLEPPLPFAGGDSGPAGAGAAAAGSSGAGAPAAGAAHVPGLRPRRVCCRHPHCLRHRRRCATRLASVCPPAPCAIQRRPLSPSVPTLEMHSVFHTALQPTFTLTGQRVANAPSLLGRLGGAPRAAIAAGTGDQRRQPAWRQRSAAFGPRRAAPLVSRAADPGAD